MTGQEKYDLLISEIFVLKVAINTINQKNKNKNKPPNTKPTYMHTSSINHNDDLCIIFRYIADKTEQTRCTALEKDYSGQMKFIVLNCSSELPGLCINQPKMLKGECYI